MRIQDNLFRIECALILVLGLTLVSGYAFAQTQYAYTTGNNTGKVSEIQTTGNQEGRIFTVSPTFRPRGIALTNDDVYAFVTLDGCASPNACVASIDISVDPAVVTPINTGRPAQFVAITPPLASKGNCACAFVTTGLAFVSVINVCNSTVQEIQLPAGASSLGIAITGDGTEAWVADQNNPKVYVINTSTLAVETITLPDANSAPRHVAFASINANEYRMYVTDGISGKRKVWVIKTVNGVRTIGSVVWPNDPGLELMWTYGIAVKPDNSKAYVTYPGSNNKLFTISIGATDTPGYFTYLQNIFIGPVGVAWIGLDGRAYIGSDAGDPNPWILTVINANGGFEEQVVLQGGRPFWIALTHFSYVPSPSGPSSSRRLQRIQ